MDWLADKRLIICGGDFAGVYERGDQRGDRSHQAADRRRTLRDALNQTGHWPGTGRADHRTYAVGEPPITARLISAGICSDCGKKGNPSDLCVTSDYRMVRERKATVAIADQMKGRTNAISQTQNRGHLGHCADATCQF